MSAKYRWTFLHEEKNREYNIVSSSADSALSWLEYILGTTATFRLLSVAELGSSRWVTVFPV